jgi:cyanate permease
MLGALECGWISEVLGMASGLGAVAVLAIALVWLPLRAHDRRIESPEHAIRARRVARVGQVWPLVLCFGFVSAQDYAQLGWHPDDPRHAGAHPTAR